MSGCVFLFLNGWVIFSVYVILKYLWDLGDRTMALKLIYTLSYRRERVKWALYYTTLKFYNNDIKFVGLTTLGTIEGVILCSIIGDVHQFIGYCLIP